MLNENAAFDRLQRDSDDDVFVMLKQVFNFVFNVDK
jgi:hypothetical protein